LTERKKEGSAIINGRRLIHVFGDSEVWKRNAAAHSRYREKRKRLAHGDGKEQ